MSTLNTNARTEGAVEPRVEVDTSPAALAKMVGQVFEAAPANERSHLIELLMRPLGLLGLAAVANGVFAKLRLQGDWNNFRVLPDDAQAVRVSDVVALTDYVQQVCSDIIDILARAVADSPVLAGTAAAAMLISVLLRRSSVRTGN